MPGHPASHHAARTEECDPGMGEQTCTFATPCNEKEVFVQTRGTGNPPVRNTDGLDPLMAGGCWLLARLRWTLPGVVPELHKHLSASPGSGSGALKQLSL